MRRLRLDGSLSARLVRFGLRALGLYARGRANALAVEVSEVVVPLPDLPQALDGYRILHLSDLHFTGDGPLVDALRARLAGLRADAAVLTGDLISRPYRHDRKAIETLEGVVHALRFPDGVYGVPGNHDSTEVMRSLAGRGVRVLEDRSVSIRRGEARLTLVGMRSAKRGHRPDYASAFAGLAQGAWIVLLVHKPDYARGAARRGVSLYLCGHTHGGQVSLPLLGPPALGRPALRRYGRGLWRQGRMAGDPGRGVGTSFVNVRFGCPPEVALLTLRKSPGPTAGRSRTGST